MDLPNITPEVRGDLLFYKRQIGDEQGWIVKDPIQRNYYWFNQFQSWLLKRFDGLKTLMDVKQEFEIEFAPCVISEKELLGFLVQSSMDQLLVESVSGARLKTRSTGPPKSLFARLQSVFAIRLPAVNVRKPVDIAESIFGFLFSKTAFILFLFGFILAIVLLFQNATVAWSDLQIAFRGPHFAVGVLLAISITKIFHEFGHAVACRKMGAGCVEGGLMFLFFAPCLYCDVSDARIIDKKFRRSVVMLGGVYFELILATIAILIWANCDSISMRNFLLNISIVASISTILVNLNPLMKFDGYYVFSEWMAIHNLSGKSQAAVRDFFRSMIFQIPKSKISKSRMILGYGFSSKVYRLFVYSGFFWLSYSVAGQFGLSAIVVGFGVLCCVAFAVELARQSFKTIAHDRKSFRWRPVRSIILTSVCVLLLVVFFFGKIPSYIYCDAEIRYEGQLIAAPERGVLVWANEPGKMLGKDETILLLRDDELSLANLDAMNHVAQIESSLATMDLKASFVPDAASKIPELTGKLSAAKKQHLEIGRRISALDLKAPFAGQIINVAVSDEPSGLDSPRFGIGSLLDQERLGQRVSVGDKVCFLARKNIPPKITIFVKEKKLDQIHVGQRVWIRPSGSIGKVFRCRIMGRQSQVSPSSESSNDRRSRYDKVLSISAHWDPNEDDDSFAGESEINRSLMEMYLHQSPAKARILASRKTPFQMVLRLMAEAFGSVTFR